jgi:hypothetical protein
MRGAAQQTRHLTPSKMRRLLTGVLSLTLLTLGCGGTSEAENFSQEPLASVDQALTDCTCYYGYDEDRHAIPPASTYCGMVVCSYAGYTFTCGGGGWSANPGQSCDTCEDGVMNGNESGKDCGGHCSKPCH